jgi:hypothetical protein
VQVAPRPGQQQLLDQRDLVVHAQHEHAQSGEQFDKSPDGAGRDMPGHLDVEDDRVTISTSNPQPSSVTDARIEAGPTFTRTVTFRAAEWYREFRRHSRMIRYVSVRTGDGMERSAPWTSMSTSTPGPAVDPA